MAPPESNANTRKMAVTPLPSCFFTQSTMTLAVKSKKTVSAMISFIAEAFTP